MLKVLAGCYFAGAGRIGGDQRLRWWRKLGRRRRRWRRQHTAELHADRHGHIGNADSDDHADADGQLSFLCKRNHPALYGGVNVEYMCLPVPLARSRPAHSVMRACVCLGSGRVTADSSVPNRQLLSKQHPCTPSAYSETALKNTSRFVADYFPNNAHNEV
jgi:hypothetical protein